jgi:hypothetical protein
MGTDDTEDEIEQGDWLQGAKEHDGTVDAYRRFSDELEDSIGLDDSDPPEEPLPGDTMP